MNIKIDLEHSSPSSSKRETSATVNYEEIDDPVGEDHLRQAKDFYVKSSQEEKTEGRGSNNPRHSLDTRHDILAQTASGSPVTQIAKTSEHNFKNFGIFNDKSDSKLRTPLSLRTCYRIRENLTLAIFEQLTDFVARSKRLTLATDGVSIKKTFW